MTSKSKLKNRDVFLVDPTTTTIPNDGVAKVLEPVTQEQWDVLRYELTNFVCEGEYRRGLERILDTYLANLNKLEQPAVWVSGFYGSGKSHFVRVLEYLWRDVSFQDGATARSLPNLPKEINDQLKELSIAGKRNGGLWSAAGKLSAGTKSVRLAFLGIVFSSAGLPEQYAPARFVIWLKQNGYYDKVKADVEKQGKDFLRELNNMYVSPVLATSVLKAYPGFANSAADARNLFKVQYPNRDDVSDEELLLTLEDVLELQSNTPGKMPCTLLVFDELQQFIGDDGTRALQVQTIVEACSSRFGSRLLFVATGQQALGATPQMSKLQGRFTVRVTLMDTDVERVVREVVLRKKDDKKPELKAVLEKASGEIDRQLAGTKIGPAPTDIDELVPDYPLLPVRRRFWERLLRAIDEAGMAGQLRTQLRIVHDAARAVAKEPIGTVVAGDFIYEQLRSDMLQSGVLLRDVEIAIASQKKEGSDGELRARLCALIFLISRLPSEGIAATGIQATANTLADLLVEDLTAGSAELRQRIPKVLQDLVNTGTVMLVGEEYRLQTRESAEWESDFRGRLARIQADDTRIASDRMTELRNIVGETLKGIALTQGVNKVPRKFELHFSGEMPAADTAHVPVWIRDEWSVSERNVREDAQREGTESPIVFVFIPKQSADALKNALASSAAASETLNSRPRSTVPEAVEARSAMEARQRLEASKVRGLIVALLNGARVFQGGGFEINEGDFQSSIRAAVDAALVRLFPEFAAADVSGWNIVFTRAGQGAADPLSAVGWHDDADKHPVCRKIRDFVGTTGKRGSEVRRQFMNPPYGWPQDAVDGSLLALMAGGYVRAAKNGQPVGVKGIAQSQIGVLDLVSEGITITAAQRLAVRKVITTVGVPLKAGEEAEALPATLSKLIQLATGAGGDPPLPSLPSRLMLEELQLLSGNEQMAAVAERQAEIVNAFGQWTDAQAQIERRLPRWQVLEQLLRHAAGLPMADEIVLQVEAIRTHRTLLSDPDPVPPLIQRLSEALRTELRSARDRLAREREQGLAALQGTDEWRRLSETDRQGILTANALDPVSDLHIGTETELLAALSASPLSNWENQIVAVSGHVTRAREAAAMQLAPEAVRVPLPHATLKTAEEVDAYLAQLRDEIMKHIDEGRPVIV